MPNINFSELGLAVIETEANAIYALKNRINQNFNTACEILLNCTGRIVVTGMGKSGHIGKKIAATLASTGSPAFFMHPSEASHGDLGMITKNDVVIALSYSGATKELLLLLPLLKRLNIPVISLTKSAESILALASNINLDIHVEKEACPLGLAPTSSTTAALVMGDALAIALLQARGFTADDFARTHPGGNLGKKLLLLIDDLYHTGDNLPICNYKNSISEALIEVTAKKLGMTCVIDDNNCLIGIFTDGDIRRVLNKKYDIVNTRLETVMSTNPHTIKKGLLAAEALAIMQALKITSLAVTNDQNQPIAVLHIHDLLSANVY